MKIGILTFHRAHNYGAVLQAYALQYVLTDLGCEVEILDYRNPAIDRFHNYWSLKYNTVPAVLYRLLFSFIPLKKKERNFRNFIGDFLHVSKEQYDEVNRPYGYDLYIVGSDQVWNPLITGGIDPYYWGMFLNDGRLITYAASSGDMSKLSSEFLAEIRRGLSRFSAISVREERLKNFLLSEFSIPSQVVLDPTLLAGSKCFEKICAGRLIDEPYVLVYQVGPSNVNLAGVVDFIARHYHAKIVKIGLCSPLRRLKHREIHYVNPDIPTFLSLFRYADCVVPISFHGVAFSLLFEKDFYYLKGSNTARVYSILTP